jgi:adenylyltransferase/sulfurtransferase
MTVIPGKSACLKCIYHSLPPEAKFPVLGTTPAVIGAIEATEVIKYITGIGTLLTDRLLIYDGLNMKFTELKVIRNTNCEHCGDAFTGK